MSHSQNKRTRIKDKLYSQIFKSDVRLGAMNNKIILYVNSRGDAMRLDSGGSKYTSIDRNIFYSQYPITVVATPTHIFENQHYQKARYSTKVLYFTQYDGQSERKPCTQCGIMKHISEFNKGGKGIRYACRECQSIKKSEYRKTDGYSFSSDKRVRNKKLTDDKTITVRAIKEMFTLQNGECVYCNSTLNPKTMHKDHITPLSRGGHHTISNIQLLCQRCNLKKGVKTHEEFIGIA